MIRPALIALCLTAPLPALAQSQLDRLEVISEQMNLGMAQMMAREVAANGGDPAPVLAALPDTAWDAEFRAAGTCMLDRYNAAAGSDAVDTMLDEMEAMVPLLATASIDSMSDMNPLPAGVTEDQSIEIANACGIVDLSMQRLEESGFTAAMMQAFASTQGN